MELTLNELGGRVTPRVRISTQEAVELLAAAIRNDPDATRSWSVSRPGKLVTVGGEYEAAL